MRKLVAGLVLVVASASQAQVVRGDSPSGMPEAQKFSVVIERSGTQWKARCELGCAWTGVTLAFSCAQNCDAILDANGLVTTKAERTPNAAFSFVLSAASDGQILAKPSAGTHWRSLGWSCGGRSPCTARVNEFGVSGIDSAFDRGPSR